MTSSLAMSASVRTRLDDVVGRAIALPAAPARQPVLGMGAAYPMDRQDDLRGRIVDIGDRLVDEGTHDPLLQPGVSGGCGPDSLKVFCERLEGHRRKRCECRA